MTLNVHALRPEAPAFADEEAQARSLYQGEYERLADVAREQDLIIAAKRRSVADLVARLESERIELEEAIDERAKVKRAMEAAAIAVQTLTVGR